jgi:hypothetical protein
MKIGLIIEDLRVARWQADALATIDPWTEFYLYNCTRSAKRKRSLRHALYYLLNLVAIRSALTAPVQVHRVLRRIRALRDFEAEVDGNWEKLPPDLVKRIRQDAPDVIVKFGLGLLRLPDGGHLATSILSYHHGDPDHFRGRPAGFYETLQGRPTVGQIVQGISNKLDAGSVFAFAETRVCAYSYRATMREAYAVSPLLLNQAIRNAIACRPVPKESSGRNYRLPSNRLVVRFALTMAGHWIRRLLYGAFVQKMWQVSMTNLGPDLLVASGGDCFPDATRWTHLPIPRGYEFLADPFFHPSGKGVLVEAMSRSSGTGDILWIANAVVRLSDNRHHYSYPYTIEHEGAVLVVPEISEWSEPKLFQIDGDRWTDIGSLRIPGVDRLADPSIVRVDDTYFLFGNLAQEGNGVLRLWWSEQLHGPYREHIRSPILISPIGGRMAGRIVTVGDDMIRFGQNSSGRYGDGLVAFRIEALSRGIYAESRVGSLRFTAMRGPHTINFRGDEAVFDWYVERLRLTAGVQRLRTSFQASPVERMKARAAELSRSLDSS